MRLDFEWRRRTRRAVSLLVIGIVALSLVVQALARRLAPEEATPADPRTAVAAGASTFGPGPSPSATAAPSAPAASSTAPLAASATSTRGPPSPTAPPPSPTAPPPSPTATVLPPTPTPPTPPTVVPPTVAPTSPAARTARVLRDQAARPALLRSEPSVRALVVGQAPAGATVEVLGEVRGEAVGPAGNLWLRVRYGSAAGYVYAPLVE